MGFDIGADSAGADADYYADHILKLILILLMSMLPLMSMLIKWMTAGATNANSQSLKKKLRLRKLCWETMFGQELVRSTYHLKAQHII